MTLPRFLADEDLRHGIVLAVRRLEPLVQVITVRDASLRAASDGEVLAFAANEGWLVLSHDVNTMRAVAVRRVAEGLPMPGLFLIPQIRSIDGSSAAFRRVIACLMLCDGDILIQAGLVFHPEVTR